MKVDPKVALPAGLGLGALLAVTIFLITRIVSETPPENDNSTIDTKPEVSDHHETSPSPSISTKDDDNDGITSFQRDSLKKPEEQSLNFPQKVEQSIDQKHLITTSQITDMKKSKPPKEKNTNEKGSNYVLAPLEKGETNLKPKKHLSNLPKESPLQIMDTLDSKKSSTAGQKPTLQVKDLTTVDSDLGNWKFMDYVTRKQSCSTNLKAATEIEESKRRYEGSFWSYMVSPDHELRDDLYRYHNDSYNASGVNFNKPHVNLDYLIQEKFGKSPLKPIFTFQNDIIPDAALLEKFEKLSLAEAGEHPFEPFLKRVLSNEGLKKCYLAICHNIHSYQRSHPGEFPLAVEFANYHVVLPYPPKKEVERLLDANWDKRASALYANNDKRVKDLHLRHDIIVDAELLYAVSMFKRRCANPGTHITKVEFDDIYSAFKKFHRPALGLGKKFEVSSPTAFLHSILDHLWVDLESERQIIWDDFKNTRNKLIEEHKERALRLHSTLKNFLILLPESENDALLMKFETLFKKEAEQFLDSSLACAEVNGKTEQEQRDIFKKVYNEYVAYSKDYGIIPIKCDDPLVLLRRKA